MKGWEECVKGKVKKGISVLMHSPPLPFLFAIAL